jgi:hypothetical protein
MITLEQVKGLSRWDGKSKDFKGDRFINSLGREIIGYYDNLNNLHIVVSSDQEDFEAVERKGISVTFGTKSLAGSDDFCGLDFVCNSIGFDDYFLKIINEIFQKAQTQGELEVVVPQVIENWYHFLEQPLRRRLSTEKLTGLFGEIASLRDLIDAGANAEKVIKAWRGPDGSKKDIVFDNLSLEVKTSAKEAGHIHLINGLDQLAGYELRNLYLFSWHLIIVNDSTGQDICELIQQMEESYFTSPSLLSEFHSKLYAAEYDKREEDHYADVSFVVINRYICKVDDKFPVLTRDSITGQNLDRITRVEYEIDLNGYDKTEIKTLVDEI